jgi:hypothetical protein
MNLIHYDFWNFIEEISTPKQHKLLYHTDGFDYWDEPYGFKVRTEAFSATELHYHCSFGIDYDFDFDEDYLPHKCNSEFSSFVIDEETFLCWECFKYKCNYPSWYVDKSSRNWRCYRKYAKKLRRQHEKIFKILQEYVCDDIANVILSFSEVNTQK